MGDHLAGAEAEVTYVEASVLDRPVSRRVLRLRGLCGSGEGEDKEEKAARLQQEVLLSVCIMLRPRPHRRIHIAAPSGAVGPGGSRSARGTSWLLVIVQIKRSSRRVPD